MMLIADSGSSKTSWTLIDKEAGKVQDCRTQGVNPFYQTEDEIYTSLAEEFGLPFDADSAIYFYGAGCANAEKSRIVKEALARFFKTEKVEVQSDLLAAARSLLGPEEGIAAILGTGSNSCYYDGEKIVDNLPPLGYILGDEGSGAVLGRKLLGDILKKQVPETIRRDFFDTYNTGVAEILDKVYRQAFPNRYLSGYTRFIAEHIREEYMDNLVKNSFVEFFKRNISYYPKAKEMPVNFCGSVAWIFQSQLRLAASDTDYLPGIIRMEPMEGLIAFHSK